MKTTIWYEFQVQVDGFWVTQKSGNDPLRYDSYIDARKVAIRLANETMSDVKIVRKTECIYDTIPSGYKGI